MELCFLNLLRSSQELQNIAWDATEEVFVTPGQRGSVVLSYEFFDRYVKTKLGNIHDWNIAE